MAYFRALVSAPLKVNPSPSSVSGIASHRMLLALPGKVSAFRRSSVSAGVANRKKNAVELAGLHLISCGLSSSLAFAEPHIYVPDRISYFAASSPSDPNIPDPNPNLPPSTPISPPSIFPEVNPTGYPAETGDPARGPEIVPSPSQPELTPDVQPADLPGGGSPSPPEIPPDSIPSESPFPQVPTEIPTTPVEFPGGGTPPEIRMASPDDRAAADTAAPPTIPPSATPILPPGAAPPMPTPITPPLPPAGVPAPTPPPQATPIPRGAPGPVPPPAPAPVP